MDTNASGGSYRVSKVTNNFVKFTFSGTSIKWVTFKGPDQGKAAGTIDGANKGTIALYSAVPTWNVYKSFNGLGSASHTIVIKVLGLKNVNSTDLNVVVDAFIVGSTTTQERALKVQYNNWLGVANTKASGGNYRYNKTNGSDAQLTFTGDSITWITAKGPAYGKASVLIDGKPAGLGTYDLYQLTAQKVRITFPSLGAGQHTIEIKPLGTKNSASTGTRVVLDAFSGPISILGAAPPASPADNENNGDTGGMFFWLFALATLGLGIARLPL